MRRLQVEIMVYIRWLYFSLVNILTGNFLDSMVAGIVDINIVRAYIFHFCHLTEYLHSAMSAKRKKTPIKLQTDTMSLCPSAEKSLVLERLDYREDSGSTNSQSERNNSSFAGFNPCDQENDSQNEPDVVSSSEQKISENKLGESFGLVAATSPPLELDTSFTGWCLKTDAIDLIGSKYEDDVLQSIRTMIASAKTLAEKEQALNEMISQLNQLKENLDLQNTTMVSENY